MAVGHHLHESAECFLDFLEGVTVVVGVALEEDAAVGVGDDELGCCGA